jgi:alcohol dehydrogenase, propanol-preferring
MPGSTRHRVTSVGRREELDLARSGAISVETEIFSLVDGPRAYERLHARTVRGRAVLVP